MSRVLVLALMVLAAPALHAADKKGQPKAQSQATPGLSCEEQKRRYRESEACFARFRRADKSLRPEAFSKCTEMTQPQC